MDLSDPTLLRLVALVALILSAFPTFLFLVNLPFYRRLPINRPHMECGARRRFGWARSAPALRAVGKRCGAPHSTQPGSWPQYVSNIWKTLLSMNVNGGARSVVPPAPVPAPTERRPPSGEPRPLLVSVLIPARNEAEAIVSALHSVLAHPESSLEVLVLDDHSTDATADRVRAIAASDPRVHLLSGDTLPPDWCGKQHACWQLAQAARGDLLVFMDADVQLSADALVRVRAYFERQPNTHLLSGVPRQVTLGFAEKLLIPLIHFILLGFLPMLAARLSRWPAFAAGCGQFFVARRTAYFKSDGHRAIRGSLHDGIQLPRQFRRHHFQTEIFDATDIAACRMYTSGSAVWRGLGKNATEGLAQPAAILPWTLILFGGQVLPWLMLLGTPWLTPLQDDRVFNLSLVAAGLSFLPRLLGAFTFSQSWLGAVLHPVGITALLAIQWQALARRWRGQPMEWRGRRYPHAANVAANSQSTA